MFIFMYACVCWRSRWLRARHVYAEEVVEGWDVAETGGGAAPK